MSEIQRFAIWTCEHGKTFGPHDEGNLVKYTDLLWYKRKWFEQICLTFVTILVCAFLAALLVHEKAARGPVVMPMGAGEKASILRDVQAMQKARDDYKALALNYKAQIKALNAKADGHVAQLAALQARGKELDRLNEKQAHRMSTQQGVVLEARRVLGVANVQIVDR